MDSQYRIYSFGLCNENFIQISELEFNNLKKAKNKLVNILHIEEKFNFVIENYSEYERELMNITLNKMLFNVYLTDWSLSVNDIHLVNRRIVNLLTTARPYIDQLEHDLNNICSEEPGILAFVKKIKNNEYDSVLGYRVMEALRNYVQHRGLPINILTYTAERCDDKNSSRHRISPIIKTDSLEKDGKFKKTVLLELKELGEKIDIKNYTREYMQSLHKIQCSIRDLLSDNIKKLEDVIKNAYSSYENKFESCEMISIIEFGQNGFRKETVHILKDILKRRTFLEKKNTRNINFISNFVTGEV